MVLKRFGPLVLAVPLALAGCADDNAASNWSERELTPSLAADVAPTAPAAPVVSRLGTQLAESAFGRRIAQAVQQHPDVRASTADILLAQADLRRASGAFRPEVTAGATTTERLNGPDRTSPFLRVSQLIYDGGASRSDVAAQSATVTSARSTRIVTAADFALQAVQAHIDYDAAQKIVALTQGNLNAHRRFSRLIDERLAGGLGGQSDTLTARSRLADAETLFVNARADLERARARFIEVVGTPPVGVSQPPRAPVLPGSANDAISGSPRMQALEAQLAAAQSQLDAARQGRLPRVEVSATALQQQDGTGSDVEFDLSLDYSFDTRGAAGAAIQRAYANTLRLESEKATLARDIARTLDFLESDRTAGEQRLRTARRAVAANRENLRATEEEFTIGRRDLLQVLDAQLDFVRAQRVVIESEQDLLITGYYALALTGDIIPAFGITLQEIVFEE